MQAVIFIGIQASGKSSFYKAGFFNTHIRINLDMLKTRNREEILLHACLRMKQPFVVDNTNPTVSDRAKYILEAKQANFELVGYFFVTNPQVAVLHNSRRAGKAQVPARAIMMTHRRLQPPTYAEGFDRLFEVHTLGSESFDVQEWQRPSVESLTSIQEKASE